MSDSSAFNPTPAIDSAVEKLTKEIRRFNRSSTVLAVAMFVVALVNLVAAFVK